jgi:hypothetical protein
MMIKVGSEYLDFNADIEMARQVKVFDELEKTAGDFSYAFEIDLSGENIRILNLPFPDNLRKNVYHKIFAELTGNDGITIYRGFIQIQRIIGNRIGVCSFFSGNNNWFGMLSGPLSDIDFSDLEVEQTEANIVSSWSDDSGTVFPLLDHNVLIQRQAAHLKIEDFVPATYVKTIIKRIFQKHSIKINGELFTDANYNKLCITRSPSDNIESRSAYVGKDSFQTVGDPPSILTFDDDTNFPFFDGAENNYNLASSEYVADVRMRITIDASVTFLNPSAFFVHRVYIVKNGSEIKSTGFLGFGSGEKTITISTETILAPGDNITISAGSTQPGGVDIQVASVRFTPTYLYLAFGDAVIPDWTQQEFVSNIFRIFNVITAYQPVTKTLTVNLFEKLKSKPPVDISEFISESETDYSDFVSNYGKRSIASYEQIEFDDWLRNSIKTFFGSGDGALVVDNDFIEDSSDIVESDFTNPQAYINPVFDMSIERLNTLELDEIENTSSPSVTESAGSARFDVDDDIFEVGDLVRISDSTISGYNGDWIAGAVGTGWVEFYGLGFQGDAVSTLTVMKHVYTGEDNVYLFFNVPNYPIANFSSNSTFRLQATNYSNIALGYFNMMNTGRQVNDDFIQSLSFGEIDSDFAYQRTMLQTYWNLAERVLNDPVGENVTVNLPYKLFNDIDFLAPLFVKTIESSNLYYPNKITGYKGKEFDATIELIKLP